MPPARVLQKCVALLVDRPGESERPKPADCPSTAVDARLPGPGGGERTRPGPGESEAVVAAGQASLVLCDRPGRLARHRRDRERAGEANKASVLSRDRKGRGTTAAEPGESRLG
jgi:hypothetical protein